MGPAIVRGIEALLTALRRGEVPPDDGVRAIYAVLIYATGYVAWELPRTRQQPQQAYTATWLRTLSSLPPEDFPLTTSVVHQLPHVAGEKQFELGLAALADGLLGEPHHRRRT
jgi:hypothetical protein